MEYSIRKLSKLAGVSALKEHLLELEEQRKHTERKQSMPRIRKY